MKKKILSLLVLVMAAMTASAEEIVVQTYKLTVGTNEHGTITIKSGDNTLTAVEGVYQIAEDIDVTVTITPDEGWVPSTVTVQPYLSFENAMARRNVSAPTIDILQPFEVPVTETTEGDATIYTATFTMPAANADISVTYMKLLSNADITIEDIPAKTYTGSEIKPEITVKDGETVLVEGTDYEVVYFDNVNAALSTSENAPAAVITAAENSEKYAGGNSKKFTINPAELSDEMIAPVEDQTYTGSEIEPALTITFGEGDNAQTLAKETDFTVEYADNIVVGTATATATGKGNFTGTASITFVIAPKPMSDDMIGPIDDLEYTGEPQEPELDVTYGDNILVEGTDYTAEYENNVETGKATVTITGKGNYEGTATANFYIGRKDLNDEDIKVEYIYWEHYDGEEHTPQLTIRDGTKQLIEDKDYKVTFKENVDAGTAKVIIDGLDKYMGRIKKYFAIFSYVLDEDMVQDIADQVWTGEAVTPAISVINGNMTLTEGKDFTVKFKNNVNEGTATVIVNGTGNFRSVDLVKTFKIVKKAEVEEPEPVSTAINEANRANGTNKTAYDLQGRKVVGNRKAVVIIDGKLVLKK